MVCDIRPAISSTKTHYLDPYETPPTCPCPQRSRSPSKRCPSHGCCRLSSVLYLCPKDCRRPLNYHRYIDATEDASSRSSRRWSRSQPRARWRDLRILDSNPNFQTRESSDFRFAVTELRDIGRILLHAEVELDKARSRVERERARHRRSHGSSCERMLDTRECGWTRRVANMVAETDDLKFSIELLAECWVKYVGLLRKYENMGQRRVSGIVEDRGLSGRDWDRKSRKGTEKAWRHVRWEDWARGADDVRDREMEKKRERERERERHRERDTDRKRDKDQARQTSTQDTYVARDVYEDRRKPTEKQRRRSWW
ncbi:hypothetical protein C8034_v007410 [Colletotrichum sidae]|uniref:Uncharacterized protein n=1 Tax=Colletotrichum sidae TaxID=1347389 RepID=A0A4V3I1T2_9PEZI|nr:hypothetical protein C8034_v007410 [Colletotrichum sidae]